MATKTQIYYAIDTTKFLEEGPYWYNVVLDINEFLTKKGFVYSRTQGFVYDGVLSDQERLEIANEMCELGFGSENFLYIQCNEFSEVIDLKETLVK